MLFDEEPEVNPVKEMFDKHENEYHKFKRTESHPDDNAQLCAFIYLNNILGPFPRIVECAEHDQIWLRPRNLEDLNEENIIYLLRCGVLYDEETDSLYMNV